MTVLNLYVNTLLQQEVDQNKDKMEQFSIQSSLLLKSGPLLSKMPNSGIWGHKNIDKIKLDNDFIFLLSFKPSRMHLGYLLLLKQMKLFQDNGAKVFCVLSAKEAYKKSKSMIDVENSITSCMNIIYKYIDQKNLSVIHDIDSKDFGIWELEIAEQLKLSKIKSLLGWGDNRNISDFNTSVNMTTAFLSPQIHSKEKQPTVISCGINEMPFIEMTKIVSKKLDLFTPYVTFPIMIKNIQGLDRMRSNDKYSIYLDRPHDEMAELLLKTFSGGRGTMEEQRALGGQVNKCTFASYGFISLSDNEMQDLIKYCSSGENCQSCKRCFIPKIMENIR